jgi:DNA-binding response OmpR family regulator
MNTEAKKILVVDDEKDLCELMAFNLRREGYHVKVVYDGEAAVLATNEDAPDLILLERIN